MVVLLSVDSFTFEPSLFLLMMLRPGKHESIVTHEKDWPTSECAFTLTGEVSRGEHRRQNGALFIIQSTNAEFVFV